MRILIIAHYFPPQQTVGAFRPLSWARYWSRAGHQVTVLTTPKEFFDGITGDQVGSGESFSVVPVNYLPFAADSNKLRNKPSRDPASSPGHLKQSIRRLRRALLGPLIDPRDLWVRPAFRRAAEMHSDNPYDLVVSTYGPPATHIIGSLLKKHLGIPWIADYRDLWADHVYPGLWPFSWISRSIERHFISRADLLTSTSEIWCDTLTRRFNIRSESVENGYDAETALAPTTAPRPGSEGGPVQVLYTGTIYEGDRDPAPVFEAVNLLRQTHDHLDQELEITFMGDLEGLDALIAHHGVGAVVKCQPPRPLAECLAMQRRADILLFLDWRKDTEGFLTAKLFEYMHAGTPIIAVGGSAKLTASRMIEEFGAGVALGSDVTAIAGAIEDHLRGKEIPYSPDREALSSYTREALAMKMLGFAEELVGDVTPEVINE